MLVVGVDCAVVNDDTANATYFTTTIPFPPVPAPVLAKFPKPVRSQ